MHTIILNTDHNVTVLTSFYVDCSVDAINSHTESTPRGFSSTQQKLK